jgi:hypothetical protein
VIKSLVASSFVMLGYAPAGDQISPSFAKPRFLYTPTVSSFACFIRMQVLVECQVLIQLLLVTFL